MRRRYGLGVACLSVGLVGGLALSGCTTSSPSPSPSGTPAGTVIVSPGPSNDIEKRKNVSLTDCEVTKSGAKATGTITNTGSEAVKYEITVIFTNASATNVGDVMVKVTAKPGATNWSADGKFDAIDDVKCVLGPIV